MSQTTKVPTPPRRKPRNTVNLPSPEQIQMRAYEIYLERQGAPGNPLEDWVRAEQELLQRYSHKP